MTMTKKPASRVVKFSVSMPASDFREIESARGKAGKSRSRFLRDALLGERGRRTAGAGSGPVREDRSAYGSPGLASLTDAAELRRRAVAAAGSFSSGVPDLSTGHDRHLADEASEQGPGAVERKGTGGRKQ